MYLTGEERNINLDSDSFHVEAQFGTNLITSQIRRKFTAMHLIPGTNKLGASSKSRESIVQVNKFETGSNSESLLRFSNFQQMNQRNPSASTMSEVDIHDLGFNKQDKKMSYNETNNLIVQEV